MDRPRPRTRDPGKLSPGETIGCLRCEQRKRSPYRRRASSGDSRRKSLINENVHRLHFPRVPLGLTALWRTLLACGMAAPVFALTSTLLSMAANPGFNPARQYLSELGAASAGIPLVFNAGVFAAGLMAGLAGGGFALTILTLTNARCVAGLTMTVFAVSGVGMARAALYPWPDPRHLAINLALGIQLAPPLLIWGLWPRRDMPRLKLFLIMVFVTMAALTVLTRHLIFPGLVNDANVGWWERAYALILVGWVGIAAFALDRCLLREAPATKTG